MRSQPTSAATSAPARVAQSDQAEPLMLKFHYRCQATWPPLAWLAELPRGKDHVIVAHGAAVETTPDWYCEAVWNGHFPAGDFDRTDVVTGSGGRLREDGVYFVSSGSTVDRLQTLDLKDRVLVSNSLACLLAYADASLDPTFPRYATACFSVIKGLDRYMRTVPCSRGEVEFCYFDNLVWNGQALSRREKPNADRNFDTFQDYRDFLASALETLFANMRAYDRKVRYEPIGTLSTGYDSTFATVLTKPLGMREVICFEHADKHDSGAHNARKLGVEPMIVPLGRWRSLVGPEVPFIAGDGVGEEVHFSAVADKLRQRVLVTGYHGDKVWEKDTPYTAATLIRGDMSGMSLTEFRLAAGFIHCPIAFFGARQVADIKRISNSPEMTPWDTGGHYSRPICRRIIEEAGLPRDAFGTRKSHASRWFAIHPEYLTDASASSYRSWLRAHRGRWLERGSLPPVVSWRYDRWRTEIIDKVSKALVTLPGYYRLKLNRIKSLQLFVNMDASDYRYDFPLYGLRRYAMPWAVEETKRRYVEDRSWEHVVAPASREDANESTERRGFQRDGDFRW